MKKILIIISIFLLSACSNIAIVKRDDFKISPDIMAECGQLHILPDATDTNVLKTDSENMKIFAECKRLNQEKGKVLNKLQSTLNSK